MAGFTSGPVLFAAAAAMGLLAGAASYLVIERPLLKLFHRRAQPRAARAPLPATS
jgi:peptidoglycan/LPS O-acetylase OafA/YrhL